MLLKRGDIYYFRWQIPFKLRAVLGQREIIKSLRTPDKLTAQLRAAPYLKLIHQIKKASLMEALSQPEFEQLIRSAWDRLNQLIPKRLRRFEADEDLLEWTLGYLDELRGCYDPERDVFITNVSRWHEAFEQCQIDPSQYNPDDQEKLLQSVLQLYYQYWLRRMSQISTAQKTPDAPSFPAFLNETPTSTQRSLSTYWDEFVAEKTSSRKWTERKSKEYATHFNNFLEIIDDANITPDAIGKPTVNIYLQGLQQFPLNRSTRYPGIKLVDIKTTDVISLNTAKQQLDIIKMFFTWLEDEDVISKNVFRKADIAGTTRNYASLDQTDIDELFNLPEHLISKPWQFWIPRIAIYTGARQTEIAQLSITDIKNDIAIGILYFTITDEGEGSTVKSEAAIRRVPIPQTLLDNGFAKYIELVKGSGYTPLWPDLKPKTAGGPMGANVSAYWTQLKTKHHLPTNAVNYKGHKKVFHSLRRIIINRLWNVEKVDLRLIQTLVGHEPDFGATESYLDDEVALPTLQEAINKLSIANIGWDHPLKFVVARPKTIKKTV